ncbi:MAG: hypothetical protein RLZZ511_1722 [Cyanobacteriota bacterium]|jgi:hypothetical protein
MTVREELMHELESAPDEVVRALLTLLRSNLSTPTQIKSNLDETPSFFDVAQASIGAGEGPGDLSTNPGYMQGYGQ